MEKSKPLYRSCKNRILAGVAGGIGDYFNIDAVLVRLIFVLLTIPGGAGIIIYIIAWIIIPEDPACASGKTGAEEINEKANQFAEDIKKNVKSIERDPDGRLPGRVIAGLAVMAIGILFLLQTVFNFNAWSLFWPTILIIIGLALIFRSRE